MYRQGPEVLPTLSLGLLFILGLLNNVPPKTHVFYFQKPFQMPFSGASKESYENYCEHPSLA